MSHASWLPGQAVLLVAFAGLDGFDSVVLGEGYEEDHVK